MSVALKAITRGLSSFPWAWLFPLSVLLCTNLYASVSVERQGSHITLGGVNDFRTAFNTLENPASGAESVYRTGRSFSVAFAVSASFGAVGVSSADGVRRDLENTLEGAGVTLESAQDAVLITNTFLRDSRFRARESVLLGLSFGFALNRDSYLGFHYNRTLVSSQRFLTRSGLVLDQRALDELIQQAAATNTNIDRQRIINVIASDSALYIKLAAINQFGFDYSYRLDPSDFIPTAEAFLGVGVKLMNVRLQKNTFAFRRLLTRQSATVDLIRDEFRDFSNRNGSPSLGFSPEHVAVDLSFALSGEWWSAGASAQNINAPEVRYGAIGEGCGTDTNCLLAASYADQIDLTETYVVAPRYQIGGALHSTDRHWNMGLNADLREYLDPVAERYQWVVLAVSYLSSPQDTSYSLIPDFRFSYSQNLAGLEQAYYAVGSTWGPVTLDIAFSGGALGNIQDLSKLDNSPHTLSAGLGLDITF